MTTATLDDPQARANASPQHELPRASRQQLTASAFAVDDAAESLDRAMEALELTSTPEAAEIANVLLGLNSIKGRLWERSKQAAAK